MTTINHTFKRLTVWSLTLVLGLSPKSVLAQCEDDPSKLCNPLAAGNLQEFLVDIVDAVVFLSIPVIVFFIIYAGFLFVTSGGDTSKVETAKKTALYTIIGAAVILGASLLTTILEGTADAIKDAT